LEDNVVRQDQSFQPASDEIAEDSMTVPIMTSIPAG